MSHANATSTQAMGSRSAGSLFDRLCAPFRSQTPPKAVDMFENLEPRIVLSAAFYGWVGVETLPGFVADYGTPDVLQGVSENSQFMWSQAAADRTDPDEPYLIVSKSFSYFRDNPDLADVQIASINSLGQILARDIAGDRAGELFTATVDAPGTRTYLADMSAFDNSPFNPNDATPMTIADGSGIVLRTTDSQTNTQSLWMVLPDQSLVHLWDLEQSDTQADIFVDANASNSIIGYGSPSENSVHPMLWTVDNGAVDFHDFVLAHGLSGSSTYVASLNDDGTIYLKNGIQKYILQNGVLKEVGSPDFNDIESGGSSFPIGRSRTSEFLTFGSNYFPHESHSGISLSNPNVDQTGITGPRPDSQLDDSSVINEVGLVYSHAQGWYETIDTAQLVTGIPADAVKMWFERGLIDTQVRTVDTNSAKLRFTRSDDTGVTAWYQPLTNGEFVESTPVFDLGVNPRTGDGTLTDSTGNTLNVLRYGFTENDIRTGATGFFNYRENFVVGYQSLDGEFFLKYEGNNGRVHKASLSDQLAQRGLETPAFTGQLDSFATKWGAMNIVGLDTNGDLQAVWWSPGLHSPLWTTTNLSDLIGAPTLVGNISSSTTSWNGMQVMGTDEQGHLISIWWSPSSAGWHWTDLTQTTQGQVLEAGSISSLVTPWNGISVVGRTATNELVTYWWTPQTKSWTFESITAKQQGDSSLRIAGPTSFVINPQSRQQHIAGMDDAGHLVHLYWTPQDDIWHVEDLTAFAIS